MLSERHRTALHCTAPHCTAEVHLLEFQTSWQQEFPSRVFKREHFPTCTLRADASGSYRKANSCRWECCKALTTPHTCGMCEGGAQLSGDLTSGTGSCLKTELQVGVKSAVILNDCVFSLGLRVLLVHQKSSAGDTQISTFTVTSLEFLHQSDARSELQRVTFTTSTFRNPLRRCHMVEQLSCCRKQLHNMQFLPQYCGISIHPRLCPIHLHPNPFSIQFGSNG